MIARTVTIRPSQTVVDAAKLMVEEEIGLVVVCEGNKPIGVVTRHDITNKVIAKGLTADKVLVKDIMNAPVRSVTPEMDISEASKLMAKNNFERLPVVSMGKLVGIISDHEIAKVAPAEIEVLLERLTKGAEPGEGTEDEEEHTVSGECELCYNFSETLHKVNSRWVCDVCKDEAAEI